MSNKLTEALAALKKVSKGEGVVSMNAEQLTAYAQEQITKASQDSDDGKGRLGALEAIVTAASDVFKAEPTTSYEFVVFVDPPAQDSNDAIAKSVVDLTAQIATLVSSLSKATDNEAGKPTTTTVHPPPVPDGHEGGSVATNQPQGDDGTPRGELTKNEPAVAAAPAAAAPADSTETVVADADAKDKDETVAKSDDEPYAWPLDLASADARAGITKREDKTEKPAWGYDGDSAPV